MTINELTALIYGPEKTQNISFVLPLDISQNLRLWGFNPKYFAIDHNVSNPNGQVINLAEKFFEVFVPVDVTPEEFLKNERLN